MTGFSCAPGGHSLHGFSGYQYDWESVLDLLGKRTDTAIAERLGCARRTVTAMRQRLRIPRFRKSDAIRPLLGRHPDRVVAELRDCSRETVTRQRREEGVAPCPRNRRRDLIRVRQARYRAAMEDR